MKLGKGDVKPRGGLAEHSTILGRRRAPRHAEDDLQTSLVEFHRRFADPRALLFAVPNGGRRARAEAARLLDAGVLPGASDLILVTHGAVAFVEVKLPQGLLTERTYQSREQKQFQAAVEAFGHRYAVVRSVTEYADLLRMLQVPLTGNPIIVF